MKLWSLQDRFHARSSLSAQLLPAAVRHGPCHDCSMYPGRLWRLKNLPYNLQLLFAKFKDIVYDEKTVSEIICSIWRGNIIFRF